MFSNQQELEVIYTRISYSEHYKGNYFWESPGINEVFPEICQHQFIVVIPEICI